MVKQGITSLMPIGQDNDDADLKIGRSTTIYAGPEDIKNVSITDFKIHKVLGRGSFGKVLLVE